MFTAPLLPPPSVPGLECPGLQGPTQDEGVPAACHKGPATAVQALDEGVGADGQVQIQGPQRRTDAHQQAATMERA